VPWRLRTNYCSTTTADTSCSIPVVPTQQVTKQISHGKSVCVTAASSLKSAILFHLSALRTSVTLKRHQLTNYFSERHLFLIIVTFINDHFLAGTLQSYCVARPKKPLHCQVHSNCARYDELTCGFYYYFLRYNLARCSSKHQFPALSPYFPTCFVLFLSKKKLLLNLLRCVTVQYAYRHQSNRSDQLTSPASFLSAEQTRNIIRHHEQEPYLNTCFSQTDECSDHI